MNLALVLATALVATPLPVQPAAQLAVQADVETLGGGTAGAFGQPRLSIDGAPLVGKPFGLRITDAPPSSIGVVAASATASPILLPEFGATIHPLAPFFAFAVVGTDSNGASTPILSLSSMPAAFVGAEFHAQALVADGTPPGFLAFTSALRIQVGDGDGAFDVPGEPFVLGDAPSRITDADLNGDGVTDLVVLQSEVVGGSTSTWVEARLADGAGGYGAPIRADGTERIVDVVVADFDRDGVLDLGLHQLSSGDDFAVVLGNGDGSFGPPLPLQFGSSFDDTDVVRLPGDAYLDLVVTDTSGKRLLFFEGIGNGSFFPAGTKSLSFRPASLLAANLDGAHGLDFVVTESVFGSVDPQHWIFSSTATGDYQSSHAYPVADGPLATELADLDGDGVLDLVLAGWNHLPGGGWDDFIHTRLGNGDGSFAAAVAVPFQVLGTFDARHLVDVDQDGNVDLIVRGTIGDEDAPLAILPGLGDGTFGAPIGHGLPVGSARPHPVDVDLDGELDLVLPNSEPWGLGLARGLGGGAFDLPGWASSLDDPADVVVADLDRDGHDDVAMIGRGPVGDPLTQLEVLVQFGDGDGGFTRRADLPVGVQPQALVVDDLDGDGWLDLAVANYASGSVSIIMAEGDGAFAPQVELAVGVGSWNLETGDVDGDGAVDLVVANRDSDDAVLLVGNGDGSFAAPVTLLSGDRPRGLALRDFDGDGVLDLASTSESVDTLSVRLGLGGGAFAAPVSAPTGDSPIAIEVADVDRDGALDLVVLARYTDEVSVHLGLGDGTFAAPLFQSLGDEVTQIALVDLDRDGVLDLVSADAGPAPIPPDASVSIRLGLGDGTFAAPSTMPIWPIPSGVVALHANGDGMPDLFVAIDRAPSVVLTNLVLE